MYTQCPECQNAFKVTANLLRQAYGEVRCSKCNAAFSAIEYLTEDPPSGSGSEIWNKPSEDELLQTLDHLAGPDDVHIEDTGIEWQVRADLPLPEEPDTPEPGSQESLDLINTHVDTGDGDEVRFDDNTPFQDESEDVPPETGADHPLRRAEDQPDTEDIDIPDPAPETEDPDDTNQEEQSDAGDPQDHLELGEPDDWRDLLDEVDDDVSDELDAVADSADLPMEVEEELAAIHEELAAMPASDQDNKYSEAESAAHEDDFTAPQLDDNSHVVGPAGNEVTTLGQPDEDNINDAEQADGADGADGADDKQSAAEDGAEDEVVADEALTRIADTDTDDADEQVAQEVEPQTPENEKTIAGVPASLLSAEAENVESIVMEGDTISSSGPREGLAGEFSAEQINIPPETEPQYTLQRIRLFGGRRKSDQPGIALTGGIVVLALLLAAQLVHANRQYLSTFKAFTRTAAPVYRLFGRPVTPTWNVNAWEFESTSGATDENDEVLTIYSQIANGSDQFLPYPLVHVSLTDRWEEIIGSSVLEPREYLAGNTDPGRPVAPGENFTAAIVIESPSPEATGFKLNVCYRADPGRVRCATGDFKR